MNKRYIKIVMLKVNHLRLPYNERWLGWWECQIHNQLAKGMLLKVNCKLPFLTELCICIRLKLAIKFYLRYETIRQYDIEYISLECIIRYDFMMTLITTSCFWFRSLRSKEITMLKSMLVHKDFQNLASVLGGSTAANKSETMLKIIIN